MAQTQLFKPLKNTTGDFYMFSQYADDVTRQHTYQEIYKVVPSRFAVLQLNKPDTSDPQGQYTGQTLADYVCRCFQNYYENKVNFMRTMYANDTNDPWTRYDCTIALWQALEKFGFIHKTHYTPQPGEQAIDYYPELKYVEEINLYSNECVDGVNYNEIYCYIPTYARRTLYNVTNLTPQNRSRQIYPYTFTPSTDNMMGWNSNNYPSNVNIDMVATFDEPDVIYTQAAQHSYDRYCAAVDHRNYQWERPDIFYGINTTDQSTNLTVETSDDNFVFNAIIIFYDIYNEHQMIERSLPLGIFFLGYDDSTDNWTNEMTKWVANDDIYGQGTAYGLRVATRYVTTPNSTYFLSSECEHNDHFACYSTIMSGIGDAMQTIEEIAGNQSRMNDELRQHLSNFRNYTTNVPYIRNVNNVPTWFVNGRNTGVTAGGSGQYNEYFAGTNISITEGNYINCTLDDFVGLNPDYPYNNGTNGLVPAPLIGQNNMYLNSDGTWHRIDWSDIDNIPPFPEAPTMLSQLINNVGYITINDLDLNLTEFKITVDNAVPPGLDNFFIYTPSTNYRAVRNLDIITGTQIVSDSPYIGVNNPSGTWRLSFTPNVIPVTSQLVFGQTVTVARVFGTPIDIELPSIGSVYHDTTYTITYDTDAQGTIYYLTDDGGNRQQVPIIVPNNTTYQIGRAPGSNTVTLTGSDGSNSSITLNEHTYQLQENATEKTNGGWYEYKELIEDTSTVKGHVKVPTYLPGANINIRPGNKTGEYYIDYTSSVSTIFQVQQGVVYTVGRDRIILDNSDPSNPVYTENAYEVSDDSWTFITTYCNSTDNTMWQLQLESPLKNTTDPIVIYNANAYQTNNLFLAIYDRSADDVMNNRYSMMTPATFNGRPNIEHSRLSILYDNGRNILFTSWLNTGNYLLHETAPGYTSEDINNIL